MAYITVAQSAKELGRDTSSILYAIREGRLKASRPGAGKRDAWLIDPADWERYKERQRNRDRPGPRRKGESLAVSIQNRWKDRLPTERPPAITERQWEALTLRVREGLTYQQIGARLGISKAAALYLVEQADRKPAAGVR